MSRLPTLFVSHGAPTFALSPGRAGPQLTELGRSLPHPAAVLVVSPHWMTPSIRVGTSALPETIHDFGGFDPRLYQISYPALGHPELARRTIETLTRTGWPAQADEHRGLDHGAWVPLLHLFPSAEVPAFQVSLPSNLDAKRAWALGQALAPLAEEGVFIVGSGSLTHNLHEFFDGKSRDHTYVAKFAAWVREAVESRDHARLQRTLEDAPDAKRAHPTPEHFWPLLVAAGAGNMAPLVQVIEGGIDHGMLAMDSYVFGH
ncbi:MAG: dioxygenase [Betaproteobacteria bacterium]|nr:dioxygenase [Betaproteobacteria bacterium]